MDRWDTLMFAVAALTAVWSLVALMRRRRDQLIAEVQKQVDSQPKTKQKPPNNNKTKPQAA